MPSNDGYLFRLWMPWDGLLVIKIIYKNAEEIEVSSVGTSGGVERVDCSYLSVISKLFKYGTGRGIKTEK